jgi:GNAT superfamily N-acetyltransferase
VEYRPATVDELPVLAALTWQFADEFERAAQSCEEFLWPFLEWAHSVEATHTPFVAVDDEAGVVGTAWLALVARTPRPGPTYRFDGDLQTVYVVPERRNAGVGAALVRLVLQHAWEQDLGSVTVSSSEQAVSLYQRAGFTGEPPYLRAFPPDRV